MNNKWKKFLRDWIPPKLRLLLNRNRNVIWSGNYASWSEAQRASAGYDSRIILDKVRAALIKVRNGEAVYERDSVLFDEIYYSWPLLAGLMWIAALSKGHLNIIDFGGSLGSTYFQNRKFFHTLPKISWNIVEQAHFVKTGKEFFEDDCLQFYYDIEDCIHKKLPNAILLSSVVQYMEEPYMLLKKIIPMGFDFILFDRTSFICKGNDRLTIQTVSSEIYPASYPCWFFDRQKFYSFFKDDYDLIEEFDALAGIMKIDNMEAGYDKGFIFRRKA